ncbi:Uncharacterized protein YjbI, contains pentapeptide repeats [Desulfatibacillum alkenivorans DSM 16219]|uniref:Uncharacterized protein YjbI, contains pentapeptide repeats n=1 Tax=Desulfatibacillum alkenivorans DSM 16219 TaxID=1121393 RepID=A0A1M6UHL5_9BACT|nr:pentapeptide repeat-containing protein [Desulfatibacillum alkenivorans]SHK68669.1 Uncharacterized protein YjbI, contains pentapeptide repeats [Desulfatibacillum alkenivorans DSM 16219]
MNSCDDEKRLADLLNFDPTPSEVVRLRKLYNTLEKKKKSGGNLSENEIEEVCDAFESFCTEFSRVCGRINEMADSIPTGGSGRRVREIGEPFLSEKPPNPKTSCVQPLDQGEPVGCVVNEKHLRAMEFRRNLKYQPEKVYPTIEEIDEIIELHHLWLSGEIKPDWTRKGKQANFSNMDLSGVNFQGCNLKGAVFKYSYIDGTDFSGCNLQGASFELSVIKRCSFKGAVLIGCNFTKADIEESSFFKAELSGASFQDATLEGIDMSHCRMDNVTFFSSNIFRISWDNSNMHRADFRKAWIETFNAKNSMMEDAVFEEANLCGGSVARSYLYESVFRKATIRSVSFKKADLRFSDWENSQVVCVEYDRQTQVEGTKREGMQAPPQFLAFLSTQYWIEYHRSRKKSSHFLYRAAMDCGRIFGIFHLACWTLILIMVFGLALHEICGLPIEEAYCSSMEIFFCRNLPIVTLGKGGYFLGMLEILSSILIQTGLLATLIFNFSRRP